MGTSNAKSNVSTKSKIDFEFIAFYISYVLCRTTWLSSLTLPFEVFRSLAIEQRAFEAMVISKLLPSLYRPKSQPLTLKYCLRPCLFETSAIFTIGAYSGPTAELRKRRHANRPSLSVKD